MIRKKRIWIALTLVLAAAAAVVLVWKKEPPQIITLPNGVQYRFAGVSYGTKHVQPTTAARLFNHVPTAVTNLVRRLLGKRLSPITAFTTPEPSLVAWFEIATTNAPAIFARPLQTADFEWTQTNMLMLADQNDMLAGNLNRSAYMFMGGNKWPHPTFQAVPRRSRELQLILFEYPWNGPYREVARVRFRNPLFGRFPQWQPEPLPVVKRVGTLEARLENFMIGLPVPGNRTLGNGKYATKYRPSKIGEESECVFDIVLSSLRETNEVWTVHSAELSDATGNRIRASRLYDNGGDRHSIRGTLWPDETAWRLKVELKRKSGFAAQELVTFKNVPVPKVGAQFSSPMTNVVGGVQIVLKDFVRKSDVTMNGMGIDALTSQIRVELPGLPAGVALDFVQLKTNTDEQPVKYGEGFGDSYDLIMLRSIPSNAVTMDIAYTIQKTRTVEFFVKPPKAE